MTQADANVELIARALYAERPFAMASTATSFGHQIAKTFDWDGAPAYYQEDMLQLARAAVAALNTRVEPTLHPLPSEENRELRKIIAELGYCTPDASLEFMQLVPAEVRTAMQRSTPTAPVQGDDADDLTDLLIEVALAGNAWPQRTLKEDEAAYEGREILRKADYKRIASRLEGDNNAALVEALKQIKCGAARGLEQFKQKQGQRKSPIWHSVNVLQDNLAACAGTADRALAITSTDADGGRRG